MWIKAMLCTTDIVYAERLVRFFDKEYGNKIECNICSSLDSAIDFIAQYKIDVALFGNEFEEKVLENRKDISCIYAIMTEQCYEDKDDQLFQIDKFQRGDRIYKDILDLYSSSKNIKYIHTGGNEAGKQKIYVFTSASGGCGTTTIARAYARRCAAYEKVLYLDLGLFNLTEVVDGNEHGMDEIILALKSRRNILPFKLTSAVSSMADKVFTYGACSNGLDLLELNAEDVHRLINGITALSEYQKIIVDMGASDCFREIELMKSADAIIYIMDESDIGKLKYQKFCLFLEMAEHKEKIRMSRKMTIFLNKARKSSHVSPVNVENHIIGWAPYMAAGSYDEIVDRIAGSDSFTGMEISNAE